MKYLFIAILVVLVSVSSINAAEKPKHLFILSGQSNMAGLDPTISLHQFPGWNGCPECGDKLIEKQANPLPKSHPARIRWVLFHPHPEKPEPDT